MIRTLLRLLFGRFGRAAGVVLIVAAAWFYWWVWPERPLRTLRLDRPKGSICTYYGAAAPDGKSMYLRAMPPFATIPNFWPLNPEPWHYIVELKDGHEIVGDSLMRDAAVSFSKDGRYLRLERDTGRKDVLDLRTCQVSNAVFEDADFLIDVYSPQTWPSNEKWAATQHFDSILPNSVSNWLTNWLNISLSARCIYDISEVATGRMCKRVSGDWWAGFVVNDRCWTQDLNSNQILLYEWDIRANRQPWRLYLVTGTGVLFIIFDFRRRRVSGAA